MRRTFLAFSFGGILLSATAILAGEAVVSANSTADSAETTTNSDETANNRQTATAAAGKTSELPSQVDLRGQLKEFGLGPRRQGRRNTCSVFTTTAALEFALAKERGKGEPLSVEYLNWACNQLIGNKTEDRGQFFHHLTRAFRQYGICSEADMPYTRRFNPESTPSEDAQNHAKEIRELPFEIHWIKRIRPDARLSDEQFLQIKQTLAKGFPVAAGASHSRLLVGYLDDESQPGGGTFFTKDSGSGNFSEVTYEFAKNELNDAFWVEIPPAK